jgi:cytochrome c-type biogenesis protein CcmH/NrfG
VKYTKAFVIVALAAIAVAGSFLFLRPARSPTAPSDWILQAATALNRVSNSSNPHVGMNVNAGDPSSAQRLALEGQRLRVQRRFAEAQAVYQQAVKADPMNADAWADLADSTASAAGNDLTKGRDAIAHALAIDPQHRKALWLRASLELQEKKFATAAATWRELQALVQPGSSDARVIAANIAEADALAQSALVADGRGS